MISVEAIYENGVLKPARPLPLAEQERVRIIVQQAGGPTQIANDQAEGAVRRSHGLLGWTGDAETLRRLVTGSFDKTARLWKLMGTP